MKHSVGGVIMNLYEWCKKLGKENLLKEWNYERNGELTPTNVSPKSHTKHGGDVVYMTMNWKLLLAVELMEIVVLIATRIVDLKGIINRCIIGELKYG